MVVKIERYYTDQNYSLGNLYIDNKLLGKVCEPPVLTSKSNDELSAIPAGYYGLKVVVNPRMGTPCIKLKSDDIADNVSVRCMRPLSPSNASPYVCKVKDYNQVDAKDIDFQTWSQLLSACLEAHVNDGESYLVVSNKRPQLEPHPTSPAGRLIL